jgi:hypothetical protein
VAVVMIGIDPHKGSHTAVALAADETRLGQIRVRAAAQDRRRHGAEVRATCTQTQDQRRPLRPHDRRRPPHCSPSERGRPGRANGERLCIQRDRLTPRTGSSDKPLPDRDQL